MMTADKPQERVLLKRNMGTAYFSTRRINARQAGEAFGLTEEEIETLCRERDASKRKASNCGLTVRELLIVSGVVAEYSDGEIAEHLGLNQATVTHHLLNAMDKAEVSTRENLARFAVNHALPLTEFPEKK